MRREGNFYALQNGAEIITARTKEKTNSRKYVACPYCKIIITEQALRRHCRVYCPENKVQSSRGILKLGRSSLQVIDKGACELLKTTIFPCFREGLIKETIRYDNLLILYGNELCTKYRSQHHYPMIRNKLILMAKFLLELKKLDPSIDCFESILKPDNFDKIINVINTFGAYDENAAAYSKPTIPTTIGTALKYLIALYKSECIKKRNDKGKMEAEDLLHLLLTALPAHVNKTSTESLLKHKREKPLLLPSTSDIKKLNEYILENRNKYYNNLNNDPFDINNWIQLSKFSLISILVFNRRRPGELERTRVDDLKSLQNVKDLEETTFSELSPDAQYAVRKFSRFCIRGKLARGVPVLLHELQCIKLLQSFREKAGIHPKNPYLFALPQVRGNINGTVIYRNLSATDLMREYSMKCGAANPKTLRATQLRKHIATHSVQLNLNDAKVATLQNFMGHEPGIHVKHYRMPILYDEIVNMTDVLFKALKTDGSEKFDLDRTKTTTLPTMDSNISPTITASSSASVSPTPTITFDVDDISSHENNHNQIGHLTPIEECVEDDEYVPSESDCDSPLAKRKSRKLLSIDLGPVVRKTWRTPEKHTMQQIFEEQIKLNKVPSQKECLSALSQYTVLKGRSIPQLQMWVRNFLKKEEGKKRGLNIRKPFTTPQRHTIRRVFSKYITDDTMGYPTTWDLLEAIKKFPELQDKQPQQIKSFIQHQRRLHKNK